MTDTLQLEEGRDFRAPDGEAIVVTPAGLARIQAAHAAGRAAEICIDEIPIVVFEPRGS